MPRARPTWPADARSTSCAPATWPARSTACSRSSAGATATARSSACASTSTPSRPSCAPTSGTTRGWSPPTGPSTSSSRPGARRARAREVSTRRCGIPEHAVRDPRGPPGAAHQHRQDRLRRAPRPGRARRPLPERTPPDRPVLADFARTLGRADATEDDTFVGLGGDSLSYVELATRLSDRFADGLPAGWHTRPIGELETLAAGRAGGGSASLGTARHDRRPARAGDPLRGRQPRRPGRPRGWCPPAARPRRLQLRALPAVRRGRLPHPPAPRPVRRGPARRAVGAVGRRRRGGAGHATT